MNIKIVFLFTILEFCLHGVRAIKNKVPKTDSLIASDHQMVVKEDDGEIKTGVNTPDSFRAENRLADGTVKGVYGWNSPGGEPVTVTFSSDSNTGYHTLKDPSMLKELPPYPYSLHGEPKIENLEYSSDSIITQNEGRSNSIHGLVSEFENDADEDIIDRSLLEENEGVLVGEGDGEEEVTFETNSAQTSPGPVGNILQSLSSVLKPGVPVAQSSPSATAISGSLGMSQVAPSSSAVVGPGGVAISFPSGQALVGPGGVSISSPVSSSQSGTGGIAIAGGSSAAVAGIQSGSISAGEEENSNVFVQGESLSSGLGANNPGFFRNSLGNPSTSFTAFPVIANYFFGAQPTEYYGAAALNQGLNLQRSAPRRATTSQNTNFGSSYSLSNEAYRDGVLKRVYTAPSLEEFNNSQK